MSTNFSTESGITAVKNVCPGRVATIFMAATMLVTGILFNILVILFVRSELRDLRSRNKIDKILLLNFSYNNLFALCIGLPLHVLDLEVSPLMVVPNVFSVLCTIRTLILFISLFMGLAILTLICYDRFETLTKMQQQRQLTEGCTKKILCVLYGTVPLSTLACGSGYVYDAFSGQSQCKMFHLSSFNEGDVRRTTNFVIIGLVTVWLTVCNTTYSLILTAVGKRIKNHIQEIRNVLGDQGSVIKEIRLVKVAVSYVVAFSVVWIAFGVARGLKNFYDTSFIKCFYLVTYTASYSIFSVIPLLYLVSDRRFIVKYWRPFQNRVRSDIIDLSRVTTHTR